MSAIFIPNRNNLIIWVNALFMVFLIVFKLTDPLTVVFAYFLETIIIGLIHILKMLIVIKYGNKPAAIASPQLKGLGLILFFVFHYGLFVAVQSMFAFSFFENSVPEIKNGFDLITNYSVLLNMPGMPAVLGSLIITNLTYFYTNFWANRKYLEYDTESLFFKPYVRIFVQQFVVILAGFFFIISSEAMWAALLLILFRLPVDLVIVSIHKNSEPFEKYVKKHTESYQHFMEVKEKYQKYTE